MPFSEQLKLKIKKKADFRCCLCGALDVEIHHIVPEAEGGPNTEDNAAPLCPNCHDTFGANPQKRKFIRQKRDDWYEACSKPLARGRGLLARFDAVDNRYDGTGAAHPDTSNGKNAIGFPAFDESVAEFCGTISPIFHGGSAHVELHVDVNATAGTVRWEVSIRRNLASDHTRGFATVVLDQVCSPERSMTSTVSVDFPDLEDTHGIGPGDPFLLRVSRKANQPADTCMATARVAAVELFERSSESRVADSERHESRAAKRE